MRATGEIRIGVSGWSYPGWRGVFYPKGMPQRLELAFAARRFRSVEVNATFYRLQRPEHFVAWAEATPDEFVFAVKGPRYVTHLLRLLRCETPLANFFASGLFRLERKLGPILWQLPARAVFDPDRLARFFALLPRDTAEAQGLAKRHDRRLAGRSALRVEYPQLLRHAIEVRHESYRNAQFFDLLRRYNIALVCSDAAGWPLFLETTADIVYCRLHGPQELYSSGYDPAALKLWAGRVRRWTQGGKTSSGGPRPTKHSVNARDVYVYFDNDAKVHAPSDAAALAQELGTGPRSN